MKTNELKECMKEISTFAHSQYFKMVFEDVIEHLDKLEKYEGLGTVDDCESAVICRQKALALLCEYADKDDMCHAMCESVEE